ncbi:hypothetical protein J7L05_11585 [bacterium]|nr:hypothetical protein [bacterium]
MIALLVLIFAGCSSSATNPVTSVNPVNGNQANAIDTLPVIAFDGSGAIGLMGAYGVSINLDEMTFDITPLRTSALGESYIVSGKAFFTMTPCSDCLQIDNISMDLDGNIVLGLTVKHPFPKGDTLKPPTAVNRLDLDVFDLAVVMLPVEVTADIYSLTGAQTYPGVLINADGYTTELANVVDDASALPYKICFEDANNNRFEMGTDYQPFDMVINPGAGLNFELWLTMGYGASAKKPQRLNPSYYIPEFNRKSAWKVVVTPPEGEDPPAAGNTWTSADTTTDFTVTIDIYDWNHGATIAVGEYPDPANPDYISASSDISAVTVEVPGMTSAIVSASTVDTTQNGWDDPLTYTASFPNENAIAEGVYQGLVKVTDSRIPGVSAYGGETDTLVHAPDGIILEWYNMNEFATYQTFPATVVVGSTIELTSPNGGENIGVYCIHDITWNTILYTGDIKLEYSKDGFVSDINEIIAATEDDGIYSWVIPDDPSTTVRVRASLVDIPTVYDDSDADFAIIQNTFSVVLDGNYSFDSSRPDISPSIITKPNGDVICSYCRCYYGTSYTSDYGYSPNSGASWIEPYYVTWGGSAGNMSTMAIDAVGDAYHKIHRGGSSLIVRFSSASPNSGVYLTAATHGMALIFTHDGLAVEFGDFGNTIRYKKGTDPNSPFYNGDWTAWISAPQYTAVPSPSRLSQTLNIIKDPTNAIYMVYYSSNASDTWIRMAYNSDGEALTWDYNNDVYDGSADGYDCARDPSLWLDSDSDWHSAFILHTNSPSSTESIAYVRSDDALAWSTPVTVYEVSGADVLDWVTVTAVTCGCNEIAVITYQENDIVYLTYSWNLGQTWQTPTQLSTGADCKAGTCVTDDDYVLTCWEHDEVTDKRIEVIRAHFEQD